MRTIRSVLQFLRAYFWFVFAAVGAIAAGILSLTSHPALTNWALAIFSLIATIPLVVRMVRDIQAGKFGVDILAALAIVVSVVLGQYWAAIVIVIMLTGGEALEAFAARRAQSELQALLKRAPVIAHLIRKGKLIDVRASAVHPHDSIVIRPGEVVPADAVITDGASTFDESSLTGESVPVSRQTGDRILSGSVNIDSDVTAQVVRAAADSQYQQIVRLVQAAAEHPAPFVRLADRYSIPFTVVALTIGGVAWILSRDPIRFLDVLVVATPCPLILATPISLIAGISRASRDGIIIKTGIALEQLAQAKTFAFDKTGTLTYGKPAVDNVIALSPYKKNEVLAYAAALEQRSNHVLAAAVAEAASAKRLKLPKTKHIREVAGRGLEAHLRSSDVLVGRLSYMQESGITIPRDFSAQAVPQTATFVAVNGKLAGYITFHDEPRAETKATIDILHKLGMRHTLMVTGDNHATAEAIARQLDIREVVADTLPGDKLLAIERLTDRPVAFVGDGVNDAPVLMAADVGIALGARGSTAASESADIVIMKDSLSYVALAVAIAKRSFRIATQSIAVGIGISILLMVVFATGKFTPIAGAIAQEVLDVLVILNALRAHSLTKLPKLG